MSTVVFRPLIPLLLLVLLVTGCGGSDKGSTDQRRPVVGQRSDESDAGETLGFPGFATKNTTRVGGADPIADAAGVAQAVYPARSPDTRPPAVTLIDADQWQAAISAAQLMSRPLRAPVLLSDGEDMPDATKSALSALDPHGAPKAAGAQVIRIGKTAKPDKLKTTDVEGSDPAALARAIDKLHTVAVGAPSPAVVVAPSKAPEYAMPAAAWAAKAGDPVLWTDTNALPAATKAAIAAHHRPRIYVLGPPSAVSDAVVKQLQKLGTTRRISGADPAANSVAFARFDDGRFGWNAVDPGHGLVFADKSRPADAAAAAALSSSGTYGPLLVNEKAETLAKPLENYLLDIQPGYDQDPVRGVYNHGWLIGDEKALSIDVQSRIDSLLEIQPVKPAA